METFDYAGEIMKLSNEISLSFAVDMAKELHAKGYTMGLSIYRAARYYNVSQHLLASKIGGKGHSVHKPYKKVRHIEKPRQDYWWDR